MSRILAALMLLAMIGASPAIAQPPPCPPNSEPPLVNGGSVFGRTAPQWQSYYGAKADVNGGIICNTTIYDPTFPNEPFVTGPGSSTNGWIPQWNGTSGTALGFGLPLATTGPAPNSVVGTLPGGTISPSLLPFSAPGVPEVATNAAMAALPSTFAPAVIRLDFLASNGSPPAVYVSHSQSCTAQGLTADNGYCTAASDGGSWVLAGSPPYNVMEWGATGSATELVSGSIISATNVLSLPGGTGDLRAGQKIVVAYAGSLGSLAAPSAAPTVGSLPVTGSSPYCFTISAYNAPNGEVGGGNIGPESAERCITNGPALLGFSSEIGAALGTAWTGPSQTIPLSWPMVSGADGYIIWCGTTTGTEVFCGVTVNTSWDDFGPDPQPWWMPSAPSSSKTAGFLFSQVQSVGTNQVTLATTAATTASGTAIVRHDDSAPLAAAVATGLPLFLPCGYTFQEFLTITPMANQSITTGGVNCTTVALTTGGSGINLSQNSVTFGNVTLDASGMVNGNTLLFDGAQRFVNPGQIIIANDYNGVWFEGGTTQASTGNRLGQVTLTGVTRGQIEWEMNGTLPSGTMPPPPVVTPPVSITYIDNFQGNKSHNGGCLWIDGRVVSFWPVRFICQASGYNSYEAFVGNTVNVGLGAAPWNSPSGMILSDVGLNECPTACGYFDWEIDTHLLRYWAQQHPGNGAANYNTEITANARNVKFTDGDIFGGDGPTFITDGFIVELEDTNVYACGHSNPGFYPCGTVDAEASGTTITGGSNYAALEVFDQPVSPAGYGWLIEPGSQQTTLNGGLWIGRIAGYHDECSPNPYCMVQVAGLPPGSPPDTVLTSNTWLASSYPSLYSCNGTAVAWLNEGVNQTTDSATNIIAALAAHGCPVVANQTRFHIRVYSSDVASSVSVSGATGVNMTGADTIPPSNVGNGQTVFVDFVGLVTNTSTPAVTIQGCSQTAGNAC